MAAVAGAGFSTATDLADWLVRSLDIPFRDAHHITGRIVSEAEKRGCSLEELPLEAMQAVEPKIHQGIYDVLGVENSVRSRTSFGGTSPVRVAEQVAWWRERGLTRLRAGIHRKTAPAGTALAEGLDRPGHHNHIADNGSCTGAIWVPRMRARDHRSASNLGLRTCRVSRPSGTRFC